MAATFLTVVPIIPMVPDPICIDGDTPILCTDAGGGSQMFFTNTAFTKLGISLHELKDLINSSSRNFIDLFYRSVTMQNKAISIDQYHTKLSSRKQIQLFLFNKYSKKISSKECELIASALDVFIVETLDQAKQVLYRR